MNNSLGGTRKRNKDIDALNDKNIASKIKYFENSFIFPWNLFRSNSPSGRLLTLRITNRSNISGWSYGFEYCHMKRYIYIQEYKNLVFHRVFTFGQNLFFPDLNGIDTFYNCWSKQIPPIMTYQCDINIVSLGNSNLI